MSLPDLKTDLRLLEEAALGAGAIARDAFNKGNAKVWDKEQNHPVTEADLAVNNYLSKFLCAARPDYGWLSEETQDDQSRHQCPRTFVIDPIDGTRAFIDRTHNFVVSVALVENGLAVAGVLYNPLNDELFSAQTGRGAKLNGKPIKVTDCGVIENCKMVGYPRKFRRIGFPDMDVSVVNSMAYRIALVACGRQDATVSFTPKSDWDLAAAEVIAREAGCIITDLSGNDFRYDRKSVKEMGVICAGKTLHPLLLERVTPTLKAVKESDNIARDFGYLGTRKTDRNETMQLLHVVIGGELVDPQKTEFKDLKAVDFVGAYGSYEDARNAWKAAAQRTVDNAHMRYFVLHAHELIDPNHDGYIGGEKS